MRIVSANLMQQMDKTTIEGFKIPGTILMENAGRGVYEIIIKEFKNNLFPYVLIVAGPGNNGGDGFVIARHLHVNGIKTKTILLSPKENFKGDAKINLDILLNLGLDVKEILSEEDINKHKTDLVHAGLIVDAIFGTGLKRELEGRFALIVDEINRAKAPVIAVDIPSGLSADTGKVLGTCVRADITATMALPKIGQLIYPGLDYVGKLKVVDISMPKEAIDKFDAFSFLLDESYIKSLISKREPEAHKGSTGHLAILAGSKGKAGAAELVCRGALRSGAGLVTLISCSSIWPIMMEKLKEAMTFGIDATDDGEVSEKELPKIFEFIKDKKCLAIGPGMGLSESARNVARTLCKEAKIPVVIDADAITAIGQDLDIVKKAPVPRVLTPHPGEAARLLGCTSKDIQQNRIEAAKEIAFKTDSIVVLKGARTIVSAPSKTFAINPTGNPGMATGGMGDILTGIIAGFVTQGLSCWQAACLGVYIHGKAGDILSSSKGQVGYLASEVADELPKVLRLLVSF